MKKSVWYLVGALILALALVAVACAKPAEKEAMPTEKASVPVSGTIHQVTIKNFAFSPNQISIKVGDTVTWTNQDSVPHTATGNSFGSGNLANGQSWSYTFNAAGTFTYKCAIHPAMQGQVTVQ